MSQELSYHTFGENYFLQEELLLQEYTNTEPYDLLYVKSNEPDTLGSLFPF